MCWAASTGSVPRPSVRSPSHGMSRQPKRCANSPSESRKIPSDLGKRGTIRVTTYDPSMRVTPAETFLRGLLADGTEHLSEAIRAEAEARGLTWRSVERARAKIPPRQLPEGLQRPVGDAAPPAQASEPRHRYLAHLRGSHLQYLRQNSRHVSPARQHHLPRLRPLPQPDTDRQPSHRVTYT